MPGSRKPWLYSLLLAFIALAGPASAEAPATIRILADRHIYARESNRVRSIGNVRITYKNTALTADEVETDIQERTVEAKGKIVLSEPERTLRTDRLVYRFGERAGTAGNVTAQVDAFYFEGRRIDLAADTLRLENGSLTSCSLPSPHYRITARSITVDREKRVRARHIAFYLGKTRLFVWPALAMSFDRKGSGGVSPKVAYSRLAGPSAGLAWSLPESPRTKGEAYLGLSARRGPVGQGRFERKGKFPLRLNVSLREEPPYTQARDVLLDRLPEVEVGFPEARLAKGFLTLTPAVSAGYYRERPSLSRTTRLQAQAALLGPQLGGSAFRTRPELQAIAARYGSGDRYSVVGLGWQSDYLLRGEPAFGLGYFKRAASGTTPFLFDRIDLAEELQTRLALGGAPNRLNLLVQYDLRHGGVYNVEFALNWRYHCLEPRLTWKTRQRAVGLSLVIVGVGGT
ncbi:MAG: LPS-assembly protein LptD [Armatimonadetes bacterium]|nr:LPS-assembly protein LptD [Armatimonadota bacterium]